MANQGKPESLSSSFQMFHTTEADRESCQNPGKTVTPPGLDGMFCCKLRYWDDTGLFLHKPGLSSDELGPTGLKGLATVWLNGIQFLPGITTVLAGCYYFECKETQGCHCLTTGVTPGFIMVKTGTLTCTMITPWSNWTKTGANLLRDLYVCGLQILPNK